MWHSSSVRYTHERADIRLLIMWKTFQWLSFIRLRYWSSSFHCFYARHWSVWRSGIYALTLLFRYRFYFWFVQIHDIIQNWRTGLFWQNHGIIGFDKHNARYFRVKFAIIWINLDSAAHISNFTPLIFMIFRNCWSTWSRTNEEILFWAIWGREKKNSDQIFEEKGNECFHKANAFPQKTY